jgi:hypothetical protein
VINSKDEITVEKLKECSAAGKSILETVWAQLAVIPSLSMMREVWKWFGFYRRDAKGGNDKDAHCGVQGRENADVWEGRD